MSAEAKADKAQQILDNEVYQEAVRGARQRIKDGWAQAADPVQREELWHQLKAIEAVTRELTIIRDNGIVERDKRERQERRRV